MKQATSKQMKQDKRKQRRVKAYLQEKKQKELRSRTKKSFDYKWEGHDLWMESERTRENDDIILQEYGVKRFNATWGVPEIIYYRPTNSISGRKVKVVIAEDHYGKNKAEIIRFSGHWLECCPFNQD
jgi:hypothetical protein